MQNSPNKKGFANIAQLDKGTLRRVLGVLDLFAIGYGDVGSSIYYALGVTAFFALGATPIALMLAGFVFICTALSYAEMTSTFKDSGGSASYARHAFNDLISFIAGWGLLLDYVVTIAISAFTIGPYLIQFFPSMKESVVQIGFTIGVIFLLFVINVIGSKQSTRTSFLLMLATVMTQLAIIGIGLFSIENIGTFFSNISINNPSKMFSPSWDEFIKGVAMAMVAYTGIESIAQLSGETKKPGKSVPRSIMITLSVLLFMYLGLSIVGFSVLTPYELGHKYEEQPIAGIVENLPTIGKVLLPWVGVLAAVTLFVSANAGLMGASRLSFHMGEYYQLPRFLYKLHPKFKTPYSALLFFSCAASLVVAVSRAKMSFLADLYNFGAQIAFFSTQVSLIVLRVKQPELKRPFKVPLNIRIKGKEIPIPAILGALSSLAVWLLIIITKPDGRYLGFSWIIVGLIMYFAYRKKKQISPTAQLMIEKIKVPRLKVLEIRKILMPIKSHTQIGMIQIVTEIAKLHSAEIIALHIIEVPFSLPLDAPLPHRVQMSGKVLKTVEALVREEGVAITLELIRARNMTEAIIQVAEDQAVDVVMLEADSIASSEKNRDRIIANIMAKCPVKTWVYHQPREHKLEESASH